MREIVIAVAVGLFFFLATGAMTAVAIKYGAPSLLWDVILWGSVAGMVMTVATVVLFISAQITGRPFWMPALLINLAICSATVGLVWHFSGVPVQGAKKTDISSRNARLEDSNQPSKQQNPIAEVVRKGLKDAREDLLHIRKEDLSFATLSAWQARTDAATRLAHANGINVHNPISQHLGAVQYVNDIEVLEAVRLRIAQLLEAAIRR